MNEFILENPETPVNLDQEALLNFLDHTVLLITQAKNAEEVDLLMDDFMSEDIVNLLEDNKDMFSLLNAVWFNTFKNIFIEKRSDSFPLKVLWLPLLFKKLGWEIEDIETFEEANFKFRLENQYNNDIYKNLVELFLNGLKFNCQVAFQLFKNKVSVMEISDEDRQNIKVMIEEIEELGW